jgi:hypothetical protein
MYARDLAGCQIFFIYLNIQSFAYIFLLTFDKFYDCVGAHIPFVKKSSLNVWAFGKKGLSLHSLS